MKIPYFCCIGAELKRYAKDFDFMNQVYLYKVPTDDSIEEVLAEDYFKAISDSVLQDDILYIYEASAETLHSCRFDKQNGHITAIPLASDETLTGAVTTIIHDNLTKNRAVISNNDGKVAVSEVTSTELGYLHGATSNIQEQLNEKAKTDLSNLTSKGKNIGLWCNNAANIITEIPQDISATITNGHLIVNAGSKVYFPNGSGTFDSFTLPSNFDSGDVSNITNDYMFFINASKTGIAETIATNTYSGATAPASPSTGTIWYDTTNNSVKRWSGSEWVGGFSFPVAILSAGAVLKQVFNGFGYIGNSVFALPGTSGLVPNGRNVDGTLKNTAWTTTQVIVRTFTNGGNYSLFFDGNVFLRTSGYKYKEQENLNWDTVGNQIFTVTYLCLIRIDGTGRITYMGNRNVFHSVDYDDSDWVAHQATPSDRYIDMTLPASGGTITAPADGYFAVGKNATASGQRLRMWYRGTNAGDLMSASSWSSGVENLEISLYVAKGSTVAFIYTADGTTNYCRFIYANGAK